MIKIAALNEESEEDSGNEEEVTREALEQIALQQYAKALELQRKGNIADAKQLLEDLLETELLDDIKKPSPGEKPKEPLFNLKYLCFKNIANIQSSIGELGNAIESYTAAADLDDTDITLWYKLGLLCMQNQEYERALESFQQGVHCNPRHWPCLDKIITLQMALKYHNDCILSIHNTLQLDPGYLRALVYRRHIVTNYHYVVEFFTYLNPKYKWDEVEIDPIDEVIAEKLLKEAEDINTIYMEQLKSDDIPYFQPQLKLKKSISDLSWRSVGESLVHMHQYMSDNLFSHACLIEIDCGKKEEEEVMEVCEEENHTETLDTKLDESAMDIDKNIENGSDENNELSDKAATDTEKIESDVEASVADQPSDATPNQPNESKESKKTPVRRRGSDLRFLQQWEWCNKRRSGRKKPTNKSERLNETIYDTLRHMIPTWISSDKGEKKENAERESSPDTMDLFKLFDEKPEDMPIQEQLDYFGSEIEKSDVNEYIEKYKKDKCDIIELLKDYLNILAYKWKLKWPNDLWHIFVSANKCYGQHIDIPSYTDDCRTELLHYAYVNLLCEEFKVNDNLNSNLDEKPLHDLSVTDSVGIALMTKPNLFGSNCLELMLRYLWVKLHIYLVNKSDELALDCLYHLTNEFGAMGDNPDTFCLEVVNFTFKPAINEKEVTAYIKFLERNKQLSTVLDLYDRECYEEVLSIVIDSFEHCKSIARKQEEEMSLDFAVQLSLIVESYWALGKVEECFKWSATCLHESLKHYFLTDSGSTERKKWSLTTAKVLCCIDHVISKEGLSCLDYLPTNELSVVIEDLITSIGHQVDSNLTQMPFDTVTPWIIMHYILQREEDQGRSRKCTNKDAGDNIPNPLMVLFLAHEQLGSHGWCCKSEGKLLYFILDTVVPRLRSPALSRSLELVCQYMEQCVFCLFGHPSKKTKLKYLTDHNVSSYPMDWNRAQQLYEIFRPAMLPEIEGKVPCITAETEQLFQRIMSLLPSESEPQRYAADMEKYIDGKLTKLPVVPPLLPYKMKDIYFIMGDFYFKKEERKMSIKYNTYDIVVNNDRCESWAEIALAKAVNLELRINSCLNLDSEKDYLLPARAIIRCFKRALELDALQCNIWIEYGFFVYSVYSFCSRLLKQASENLSMNDFESLEAQKEDMLNSTYRCFTTVIQEQLNSTPDKENDEVWWYYYMLGKVAEKRNKSPSVYLPHYIKAMKSLHEADALYPQKINYNSPQYLSIEVLEIHYRIHASILKFIEQHENKSIPISAGKVFLKSIEEWKQGPFCKKSKKDEVNNDVIEIKSGEACPQAANILKRSISDAGEEDNQEAKRMKLESAAAKVRRSASYDNERAQNNENSTSVAEQAIELPKSNDEKSALNSEEKEPIKSNVLKEDKPETTVSSANVDKNEDTSAVKPSTSSEKIKVDKKQDSNIHKTDETSNSDSSSNSSSESSTDESSDSSSESSTSNDSSSEKSITDKEVTSVISACLDALEDCSIRFPQHYKALYRLAHYHFYYKKGKDIERCRDLMLSSYTSRSSQKVGGLFCERKQTNFFNSVWRIPLQEVDRPGGFSCHMNRCVLLTMDILKEIDDHKTLLELSLHLQRVPDPDKKYLRDSDREDLAQQAFSLCIQSLKGQLVKFSQQADLRSNEVERQALNSLMLDIYRAYMKAQKQPNSRQFTNLLVDAYKLVSAPINENANIVDLSMRYCQGLIAALKQKATQASIDKNNQNAQKKQAAKIVEVTKQTAPVAPPPTSVASSNTTTVTTKAESKPTNTVPSMSLPDMQAALQNYFPVLKDPMLSPQTSAALSLSYISNLNAYAGYPFQNSFQSEFYRQFLSNFAQYNTPPAKKQKSAKNTTSKPQSSASSLNKQSKSSKSFNSAYTHTSANKTTPSTSISKSMSVPTSLLNSAPLSKSSFATTSHHSQSHMPMPSSSSMVSTQSASQPMQAHRSNTMTVSAAIHSKPPPPHQQTSPGKTLQEILAEKQKHHPKINSELSATMNRLPSSMTVTKTNKPTSTKKQENEVRPKPTISNDEIIVLDDD